MNPGLLIQGGTKIIIAVIFGVNILLMSIIPHDNGISVQINNNDRNNYYGYISIDGEKMPVVVYLENSDGGTDDTPGKIRIVYRRNEKGAVEIEYDRNMGNGEISNDDRIIINRVVDAILDYHENAIHKKISGNVKRFLERIRR